MEVSRILAEIDAQIEKLQQARTILSGGETTQERRSPGRPKANKESGPANGRAKKRKLSPEGRKRIADAMKRRWAERRKSLAKA